MASELRVDKIVPTDGVGSDSGTEPGGTASQLTYMLQLVPSHLTQLVSLVNVLYLILMQHISHLL